MNEILSLLSAPLLGAAAGFLATHISRTYITEKIKNSVSHEYAEKLQKHKNELDAKLQRIQHDNELKKQQTELFFDHQRQAYGELLAKMSKNLSVWWRTYNRDTQLVDPIPMHLHQELRDAFDKHQLFLDPEATIFIELIFSTYQKSRPFDDGSGGPPLIRDSRIAYDDAEYIQPRIAALFQKKIGVSFDSNAINQLTILGIIRLLQRYRHPTHSSLLIDYLISDGIDAEDAVNNAQRNIEEFKEFIENHIDDASEQERIHQKGQSDLVLLSRLLSVKY
jgi:hypothetical protein